MTFIVDAILSFVNFQGPSKVSENFSDDIDDWSGPADAALVLDSSVVDFDEVRYMRSVAAAVALNLDVWSVRSGSRTVDLGSRFEVIHMALRNEIH